MTDTASNRSEQAMVIVQEDGVVEPNGKALVRQVLSFDRSWDSNIALRHKLFEPDGWGLLVRSALSMRVLPAVIDSVKGRQVFPSAPFTTKGVVSQHHQDMQVHTERFAERRNALVELLHEIVAALNQQDIQPTLLKGARYLWLDENPTRTMRDLDFLVKPEDADHAWDVLRSLGFAPQGPARDRERRHHMPPLFRDGTIGWVELHRRAGNSYAEQFLSTAEIHTKSTPVERMSGTALLPDKSHHVWHAMVHHHFGHSGFARGRLELKGLFEFANAISSLRNDQWHALLGLAARSSLAWASFEVWCAASEAGLAASIPADETGNTNWLSNEAKNLAQTWLKRWEESEAVSGAYPGYRELLSLAGSCEPNRLKQSEARRTWLPAKIQAGWMMAPKLIRS